MAPTLGELAREMAERNERCGHIDADRICLRQLNHAGTHEHERIDRVIPIH